MQANPPGEYSSDDLVILTVVLGEALEETINGARLGEMQIQELSSRLGTVIMDRYTAGETEPARLKAIAVQSIQGKQQG